MINREQAYIIGSKIAASASLFMGGIAVEAIHTGHYNTAVIFGALAVSEAGAAVNMRSGTETGNVNSPDTD